MKIQLLKRTVKLPNRPLHILLLFQEKKTTCTNTPKGFRVAFNVKHFASFLRKYEIRLKKKPMQTVAALLAMSFCEFQAVKFSQSREIHRCTRKRQGCTRNRHQTSGRGSRPDRSIRLCACGTLRTAD